MFKKFGKAFILLLMLSMLSACANTDVAVNEPAAEPAAEQTVITVGTMGTYYPYSFLDEEGNLTGYDVEAVRLLDEKMEDITIEFETGPLPSLFMELDAGRYTMVANQIAKNPEREEKYLFSEDGYIFVQSQLVVNGDDNTHTSLADMEGEVMGAITGDYYADVMETYNEENGNPYEIKYFDGEYVSIFMDMDAGRVAGTLNDTTVVNGYAKSMGLNIKAVGDIMESSFSYFCIRNDETGQAFKTKLDAALKEAREDGTLAALSVEWFNEDFTNEK